jgi:hypothetical protein
VAPLNYGQISVTPITVRTTASLEQMRKAANNRPPWQDVVGAGWGSVYDDPGPVNHPATYPIEAGNASIAPEEQYTPEHLRARVYWRESDKKAQELLGQATGPEVLRIAAADVLISESVEDNEYQCLVSVRNPTTLKRHIVPALEDLLQSIDPDATVEPDVSPLALTDSDFFRWLLYRGHEDPQLNEHITVVVVRDIAGKDGQMRPTTVTRGADLDRPELIALIMAAHIDFGPIKVAIKDSELKLEAEFELRDDGGFNVLRGSSWYRPEDAPHDEKGLRLVTDLAFKVVPEMRACWNKDNAWTQENREKSIDNAIEVMEKALLALREQREKAKALKQSQTDRPTE